MILYKRSLSASPSGSLKCWFLGPIHQISEPGRGLDGAWECAYEQVPGQFGNNCFAACKSGLRHSCVCVNEKIPQWPHEGSLLHQGSADFFHQGQDNTQFRFWSHVASFAAIHLCHCRVSAATENRQMNWRGCVLGTFFTRRAARRIQPLSYSIHSCFTSLQGREVLF